MDTGYKLTHKKYDTGVLSSFMGGSKWRNREVVYAIGLETTPAEGCGPLSVYEGTPEGLEAAMKWARIYTEDTVAVHSCSYQPSQETESWFTYVGDAYKWMRTTSMYGSFDLVGRDWVRGQVIRAGIIEPHTVLADMVVLEAEVQITGIQPARHLTKLLAE